MSTTGYQWLRAQIALEKATCANLNFDFETAAFNVELSRTIAQRFQFPELGLRVTGFDAGIQRGQENYDRAWKKAEEGLAVYWQGKCREQTSAVQSSRPAADVCPYSLERLYQFYSVMQQCARKTGLQHASEALLLQGIAILENSAPDDISLKATLYLRLADILSRQGETDLAEEKAAKAESLLKQISTNEPTAQLYAAVTRIELAEFKLNRGNANAALSEIEPLQSLLSTQDDFVQLDFYAIEGDIFRQLGKFENAVKSYQYGVEEAETSLSDPQDTRDQLNWRLGTGRVYRGLTRSLLALGREHDALAVWEQFQSHSLANTKNSLADGKNLDRSPVFATLPSVAQPHLIYASFDDGLQVWLLKGSQLQSKWIPLKRDDLQQEVREFAKECSDPSLGLDKAQSLYAMILQPVASDLPPSSTVSVELDEPMWGLTIEALRNNNGRYFADDHPVVYTPGLLAENSLRQPSPLTSRDPMLLVDASHAVAAAPLPGHSDEVAAVKQAFPKTKTLDSLDVSPNAVRHALAQSREFHFSGHGKREGTGVALMIGSESSLGAKDFAPGRLQHLQLAVLSACSSASARNGAFDQSNLVRSFLAGGVPDVIASRWDVDSRSTAHFMQTFYARLHNGEQVSEALQHAQAEMRSLNNHPYYWAAFTLTGRVD